jgi:hypothetical protein
MTVIVQPAPFRPTAFDFAPPVPWTCPRCLTEILTREASTRYVVCGFLETGN